MASGGDPRHLRGGSRRGSGPPDTGRHSGARVGGPLDDAGGGDGNRESASRGGEAAVAAIADLRRFIPTYQDAAEAGGLPRFHDETVASINHLWE